MGRDDDGVVPNAGVGELFSNRQDARQRLADKDVDAGDSARALGRYGIDRHRGLARIAVTDDQLTLTAANGYGRIDDHDSGDERLVDVLALHELERRTEQTGHAASEWRATVEWCAQGIECPPQGVRSDRQRG